MNKAFWFWLNENVTSGDRTHENNVKSSFQTGQRCEFNIKILENKPDGLNNRKGRAHRGRKSTLSANWADIMHASEAPTRLICIPRPRA